MLSFCFFQINKLEKDLEEKRRYMDIFEKWILDAEEVLKNKVRDLGEKKEGKRLIKTCLSDVSMQFFSSFIYLVFDFLLSLQMFSKCNLV